MEEGRGWSIEISAYKKERPRANQVCARFLAIGRSYCLEASVGFGLGGVETRSKISHKNMQNKAQPHNKL